MSALLVMANVNHIPTENRQYTRQPTSPMYTLKDLMYISIRSLNILEIKNHI